MVNARVVDDPVQGPSSDRIREAHVNFIGQDDDAYVPVWHHTDIRAKAARSAIVPNDVAVRRLLNYPTQRVEHLVRHRNLWRVGDGEILGRNDAFSLEVAAAEL